MFVTLLGLARELDLDVRLVVEVNTEAVDELEARVGLLHRRVFGRHLRFDGACPIPMESEGGGMRCVCVVRDEWAARWRGGEGRRCARLRTEVVAVFELALQLRSQLGSQELGLVSIVGGGRGWWWWVVEPLAVGCT